MCLFLGDQKLEVSLTSTIIITNYIEPQIDFLLYETHYCLVTKFLCSVNKDSHMRYMCNRFLICFALGNVFHQYTIPWGHQQPTSIAFP